VPGLWAHFGHFRNGITLAPATAATLVDQLVDEVTGSPGCVQHG